MPLRHATCAWPIERAHVELQFERVGQVGPGLRHHAGAAFRDVEHDAIDDRRDAARIGPGANAGAASRMAAAVAVFEEGTVEISDQDG